MLFIVALVISVTTVFSFRRYAFRGTNPGAFAFDVTLLIIVMLCILKLFG